jgi:copper chaperone CopZ
MDGVDTVKVFFHQSKVKVHFDELQIDAPRLTETIEKLGYATKGTKES